MHESDTHPSDSTRPVRVLLVGGGPEDADWVRATLEGSSSRSFDLAHAPGPAEALPETSCSDVMLLGVGEAERPALDLVRKAASGEVQIPLLVLSEVDDEAFALEALGCGASGFLVKSEVVPRMLVTALVTALDNHRTILQLHKTQRQAVHLATHDHLTNLENHSSFRNRLSRAMARAVKTRRKLAVIFTDLEGLKAINESCGHRVGDQVLREVAARLLVSVRVSDAVAHSETAPAEAAVSRVGGGQFTVLLTEISDAQDSAGVARRILDVLSSPYYVDDREVFASASVGIAVYPFDGENADALMRNANAAMYQAKSAGRNEFRFFAWAMNAEAARKLDLSSHLHRALERGELFVHYQPVRHAATGKLTGAEALLRWSGPEVGPVSPAEFIPIAEETGLILPIGEWVLNTACAQSERWRDAGLRPIRLSVNLSAHQLRRETLIGTVRRILAETGMSPAQLELEITESAFVENEQETIATLRELHDLGVGLALDDFGTGYSALSYLRRFPIDRLKMDRSFISEIVTNSNDAALAAAVIAMAHTLRLPVVAEGVETLEQADLLRARACDELQGFLFSPAVSPDEFARFLDDEKEDDQGREGSDGDAPPPRTSR